MQLCVAHALTPAAEGSKTRKDADDGSEDIDDENEASEHEAQSEPEDEEESYKVVPTKRRKTSGAAQSRSTAPRKRARKAAGSDDEGAAKGEYIIWNDNRLFNSIRSTRANVQKAVDDWIGSYQDEDAEDTGPGVALAELVNFVLRVRQQRLKI